MHHGDKAGERGKEAERERVSLSIICAAALSFRISLPLSLPTLPVQHRPWQGVSHSDLLGLRKTGSQQTAAEDREIGG